MLYAHNFSAIFLFERVGLLVTLEIPDICSMIFLHLSSLNPRFLWLRLTAARKILSPLHPCAVPYSTKSPLSCLPARLSVFETHLVCQGPLLGEFPWAVIYTFLDKQDPRISKRHQVKVNMEMGAIIPSAHIHSFHTF